MLPYRIGGKAFLGTPDEAMGTYMIFEENRRGEQQEDASDESRKTIDFVDCANKTLIFHPVKLDSQ